MDAKTFNQTIYPVLAITSVPKYKRGNQQEKQQKKKSKSPLDALLENTMGLGDIECANDSPGCYGRDARTITRNVSHFYVDL